MAKLNLNTSEGQYKAGLFCAKNHFNLKMEDRIDRLNTRALIYRIYINGEHGKPDSVGCSKNMRDESNKQELESAWYNGINEGKRIRK